MLRVTIEIVPHGIEECARVIAKAAIINNGTGTAELGNYQVSLAGGDGKPLRRRFWKKGSVLGFPREKRGAWDLLYLALAATVGKRNKGEAK